MWYYVGFWMGWCLDADLEVFVRFVMTEEDKSGIKYEKNLSVVRDLQIFLSFYTDLMFCRLWEIASYSYLNYTIKRESMT